MSFVSPLVAEAVAPLVETIPAQPGARVPRSADRRSAGSNSRLLPTLFDRLRDDEPQCTNEATSGYAVSASQLRAIVQRDLGLLLNTTNAEDLIDRTRHADAAMSTINYGVPPLAGSYFSERRWIDIERIIRRAIVAYEPRLIPETVAVLPLNKGGDGDGYNVLLFEIRAMIELKPYPLELLVQSSVDLETNRMQIVRASHGPTRSMR